MWFLLRGVTVAVLQEALGHHGAHAGRRLAGRRRLHRDRAFFGVPADVAAPHRGQDRRQGAAPRSPRAKRAFRRTPSTSCGPFRGPRRPTDRRSGREAGGAGEQSLMVLGVDFLGDRSIRDWDFGEEDVLDDPLVFLAQPDSICLTESSPRGRAGSSTTRSVSRPATVGGPSPCAG